MNLVVGNSGLEGSIYHCQMLRRVAFANDSSWMRRHSVAAVGDCVAAVVGVANAVLGLVDVDVDVVAAEAADVGGVVVVVADVVVAAAAAFVAVAVAFAYAAAAVAVVVVAAAAVFADADADADAAASEREKAGKPSGQHSVVEKLDQ